MYPKKRENKKPQGGNPNFLDVVKVRNMKFEAPTRMCEAKVAGSNSFSWIRWDQIEIPARHSAVVNYANSHKVTYAAVMKEAKTFKTERTRTYARKLAREHRRKVAAAKWVIGRPQPTIATRRNDTSSRDSVVAFFYSQSNNGIPNPPTRPPSPMALDAIDDDMDYNQGEMLVPANDSEYDDVPIDENQPGTSGPRPAWYGLPQQDLDMDYQPEFPTSFENVIETLPASEANTRMEAVKVSEEVSHYQSSRSIPAVSSPRHIPSPDQHPTFQKHLIPEPAPKLQRNYSLHSHKQDQIPGTSGPPPKTNSQSNTGIPNVPTRQASPMALDAIDDDIGDNQMLVPGNDFEYANVPTDENQPGTSGLPPQDIDIDYQPEFPTSFEDAIETLPASDANMRTAAVEVLQEISETSMSVYTPPPLTSAKELLETLSEDPLAIHKTLMQEMDVLKTLVELERDAEGTERCAAIAGILREAIRGIDNEEFFKYLNATHHKLTVLQLVIRMDDAGILRSVINGGVSHHELTINGYNPLDYAMASQKLNVVRELIYLGVPHVLYLNRWNLLKDTVRRVPQMSVEAVKSANRNIETIVRRATEEQSWFTPHHSFVGPLLTFPSDVETTVCFIWPEVENDEENHYYGVVYLMKKRSADLIPQIRKENLSNFFETINLKWNNKRIRKRSTSKRSGSVRFKIRAIDRFNTVDLFHDTSPDKFAALQMVAVPKNSSTARYSSPKFSAAVSSPRHIPSPDQQATIQKDSNETTSAESKTIPNNGLPAPVINLNELLARLEDDEKALHKLLKSELQVRNEFKWKSLWERGEELVELVRKALEVLKKTKPVMFLATVFEGKPLLHHAVLLNNHGMVRLLIRNGAPVDQEDTDGFTAVQLAAREHCSNAIWELIDHGANSSEILMDWAVADGKLSVMSKPGRVCVRECHVQHQKEIRPYIEQKCPWFNPRCSFVGPLIIMPIDNNKAIKFNWPKFQEESNVRHWLIVLVVEPRSIFIKPVGFANPDIVEFNDMPCFLEDEVDDPNHRRFRVEPSVGVNSFKIVMSPAPKKWMASQFLEVQIVKETF